MRLCWLDEANEMKRARESEKVLAKKRKNSLASKLTAGNTCGGGLTA